MLLLPFQRQVKATSVLLRGLARSSGSSGLSADDFLPVFIWLVLRGNIPRLPSNCEYILAFHDPEKLMSKAGYCLMNLRSAIQFIVSMDGDCLSMDKRLFDDCLLSAIREHNGGF